MCISNYTPSFSVFTAVDNGCVAYVLRTGFYTSQVRCLIKCHVFESNLFVRFATICLEDSGILTGNN